MNLRKGLRLRSSLIILSLLSLGLGEQLCARQETIYMSVLNSRRNRLNALDNPIVGLFVSTDTGASWKHEGWEYIRTFYTEGGADGAIWSACGNGVLRSTDGGRTWRITTGWEITEVLKVRVDPGNPSVAYAASAYGIFKTTNSGETWKEQNTGFLKPFTSDIVIDWSKTSRLFAASEDGVYRSEDGGGRWALAGVKGKGVRTVVQDPKDAKILWLGTEDDGVFVSTDGGSTWKASNEGLTYLTVYAIAIDPSNSNILYVGTHGGGVYRSTDRGRSWQGRSDGLQNLVVHSLVVLPSTPTIILTGTLNGGLYRSTDGGRRWEFNSQEDGQVWGLSVR